jgi:hypothetical protein
MAYIPNYTYDIFISYAHLNNQKKPWQSAGWIEQFYKGLSLLLDELDGSKLFDQSIEEGINKTAIIVCLTSPGYLRSDYCLKELELFYSKAQKETVGLKVGDRSRILHVLLNNIPHTSWPKELSGTSGFHFHTEADNEELGETLEIEAPAFKDQLQNLRDAIVKLINEFPKEKPPIRGEEDEVNEKIDNAFTIYIGEVADSLRPTRKRIITELEKKGFKIVCGIPPPHEADAHIQKVKEELEKAPLAVHLLDLFPGSPIIGNANIGYPQKQTELSFKYTKRQLIWVPKELELAEIEDEQYKQFVEGLENGRPNSAYEFIRGTKSTLAQQIADFADQLKKEQQAPIHDRVAILLDTHFKDQSYAFDVGKILLENDIQPYINPQEDDPRKNINLLADRISLVNKLIFFYGSVSIDWVRERMAAALQLIVTNNLSIEDFYIFLAPPQKDPNEISLKQKLIKVNVINSSDQLIKNIKGAQA